MHNRRHSQLELEALSWRARWAALEADLRRFGRKAPWNVLAAHGLTGRGQGRSARERDRIADLWVNWATAPPGTRSRHLRVERLGHVWQALAEGREPDEGCFFQPDCDSPMDVEARIRNMRMFLGGRTRRQVLDVLRAIDADRAEAGRPRLDGLPPPRERKRRVSV